MLCQEHDCDMLCLRPTQAASAPHHQCAALFFSIIPRPTYRRSLAVPPSHATRRSPGISTRAKVDEMYKEVCKREAESRKHAGNPDEYDEVGKSWLGPDWLILLLADVFDLIASAAVWLIPFILMLRGAAALFWPYYHLSAPYDGWAYFVATEVTFVRVAVVALIAIVTAVTRRAMLVSFAAKLAAENSPQYSNLH